jgi:hypothetical protein
VSHDLSPAPVIGKRDSSHPANAFDSLQRLLYFGQRQKDPVAVHTLITATQELQRAAGMNPSQVPCMQPLANRLFRKPLSVSVSFETEGMRTDDLEWRATTGVFPCLG